MGHPFQARAAAAEVLNFANANVAVPEGAGANNNGAAAAEAPIAGPSQPKRMRPQEYANPLMADSLGSEYDARFSEMLELFQKESVQHANHRAWKGGLHIQSCGHYMHYECRRSYCKTLKQQLRSSRAQVRNGERLNKKYTC